VPRSRWIEDKAHLHSAAVLAASGHGNVAAARKLIRKRARDLGVEVNSLPGFGKDDADDSASDSKVAAASLLNKAGLTPETLQLAASN
jgi:hypothetical protein